MLVSYYLVSRVLLKIDLGVKVIFLFFLYLVILTSLSSVLVCSLCSTNGILKRADVFSLVKSNLIRATFTAHAFASKKALP